MTPQSSSMFAASLLLLALLFGLVAADDEYAVAMNDTALSPNALRLLFSQLVQIPTARLQFAGSTLISSAAASSYTIVLVVADSPIPPSLQSVRSILIALPAQSLNNNGIVSVTYVPPLQVSTAGIPQQVLYAVIACCGFVAGFLIAICLSLSRSRKKKVNGKLVGGSSGPPIRALREQQDANLKKTANEIWSEIRDLQMQTQRLLDLREDDERQREMDKTLFLSGVSSGGIDSIESSVPLLDVVDAKRGFRLGKIASAGSRGRDYYDDADGTSGVSLKALHASSSSSQMTQLPGISSGAVCDNSSPQLHWSIRCSLPPLPPQIARLATREGSHIHGMGIFATAFIDPNITLFPYLRPHELTHPRHYFTAAQLRLQFGADWSHRMHFVIKQDGRDRYCVAEDPAVRGWGCLLNSVQGVPDLEANCEVVWTSEDYLPFIRSSKVIVPCSELLLDYPLPAGPHASLENL